MQTIQKYFTGISELQMQQFEQLPPLYEFWNERINVVSRKDIVNLYEHHVLHSLAISKVIRFSKQSRILDVGTGGGFPGIPLAILCPDVHFVLIDSIGKKIKVVNEVVKELKLANVEALQIRSNDLHNTFDFVVSRAVSSFPEFVSMVKTNISGKQRNPLPNGILYLKGGDVSEEIKPFGKSITLYHISEYFTEPFFETKKIIYLAF